MKALLVTALHNYKTTAAGLALIFGAATDLCHSVAVGTTPNLQADMAAVMGGIGLIVAHDGAPPVKAPEA